MADTKVLTENCRLCGGILSKKFSLQVLGQYEVDYFACERCKSLQTTQPFWLDQTYDGNLPNLDYGAARRALRTCATILLTNAIFRLGRNSRVLDFGGGDGFVCRILRDTGMSAYIYDKYAKNFYAFGFSRDSAEAYDIVAAIEVLEHLANPNVDLAQIFFSRPRIVIISTERYTGQGPEWPYLGPDQGGHVFFYSEDALRLVAERFGYTLISHGPTAVFSREGISPIQRLGLAFALSSVGLLLGRIWLQLIRPQRMNDEPTRLAAMSQQ